MRIVDRHIGAELAWPFVFGVAAFTSIFFAGQNLLKLTTQVLQGMPAFTAIEIVALGLPSIVVYTLPMSLLLGVLVGFSRLSNDSEMVALYACGVSLYRAVVPVVVLGLVVSAIGFTLANAVVPQSNRLLREVQVRALKESLSANRPFVFIDKNTESTVYVQGGLNAKRREMGDVTITRYVKGRPSMVFQAERARWDGGNVWSLLNGKGYILGQSGSSATVVFAEWQTRQIQLNQTPEEVARNLMSPDDMSFSQLRRYITDLSGGGEKLLQLRVALYNKIAIPLAALVFALIGAPLAIRPARGATSVGMALSIVVIFCYWFLWHFSCALANQGNLHPAVGSFAADSIGLALGVVLLARSSK